MFERYPEESRRALSVARATAVNAGATSIEPEHLLAAALHVYAAPGLPWDAIVQRLQVTVATEPPEPDGPEIPFSSEVKRLLLATMEQADRLGHHRIRPEHMLLAFLDAPDCPSGDVLRDAGVVRETLMASIGRAVAVDDGPLSPRADLVIGGGEQVD